LYNRVTLVEETVNSVLLQTYANFELIIVDDGSNDGSLILAKSLAEQDERITVYSRPKELPRGANSCRNYGLKKSKGDYFIIFDSDCIIPKEYLTEVENELTANYVDCFGGSDAALDSFSAIQKAINFAMTSFLTTGGIRGGSEKLTKFQPRSFNMGISKKAFEDSNGFGNIHPGEDPDLSIRLWKLGYDTRLFPKAIVYHKRRIDWDKFSVQVTKFGKARPILNSWYPEYGKLTFFFPTIFVIGVYFSIVFLAFGFTLPIVCYIFYFLLILVTATVKNNSLKIGFLSLIAVFKQFFGYGIGFLESYIKVILLKQKPEIAFPELFFKVKS